MSMALFFEEWEFEVEMMNATATTTSTDVRIIGLVGDAMEELNKTSLGTKKGETKIWFSVFFCSIDFFYFFFNAVETPPPAKS